MHKIKLTKGKYALVDKADYDWLNQWKWQFGSRQYAVKSNGKGRLIYMHRLIMNTPEGMDTDHINRNSLDNRRSNLRICTRSENCRNRGLQPNNTSGVTGVSWNKRQNKWIAYINKQGKRIHLGYYATKKQAVAVRSIHA